MNVGTWGWSIADAVWYKIGANALGELLIDTDALETLLVSLIPADLEDLTFKVEEQGTPQQNCYGWSGAAWQKLLVEDATNFNLRVAIFDGAQLADVAVQNTVHTANLYGLAVCAEMLARDPDTAKMAFLSTMTPADNAAGGKGLRVVCQLEGFDGTYWDRLRTYGTGILKVGRAEIGATVKRMTAVGQVVSGAEKLMWMSVRTSAANWLVALTDAIAGGGTVIWDNGGPLERQAHYIFDPPIEFATGIYLETATNVTAVMLCYV